MPAKQVALAWAVWETADIAIQCFANAYISNEEKRIIFKVRALVLSDIVGLAILAKTGLMGSTLMTAALIICTIINRGSNVFGAFMMWGGVSGPMFSMDHVTYYMSKKPVSNEKKLSPQ